MSPAKQIDGALETFVSPLTGIVRNVVELLRAPDELGLVSLGCDLADFTPAVGATIGSFTGGCHPTRAGARAAAVGEAVERYAASWIPDDALVLASADELGHAAVDPESFALFAPEQFARAGFRFSPFRRDTTVRWVRGISLPDGMPAWLPAQLVYLARRIHRDEALIGYTTSSGLACGPCFENALVSAVLEALERDAFMITWYNRLSLPRLSWRDDPEPGRLDARYFSPSGLAYSAVDLSAFWDVPTVLGVVHGPRGQLGALGVGAAAAPTIAEAWRKALVEAFCVQRWVRDLALEQPERLDQDPAEIASFDDHTLFYARPDRAQAAAFLDSADERVATADVAEVEGDSPMELVEALAARLRRRGCSLYAVDVTTPDVRSAGLSVVRAVCPELAVLDVVESARFLGSRRLLGAAHELGLGPAVSSVDHLNPWPHPFP